MDKHQKQYQVIHKLKLKMLTNHWKFRNRCVQTFGSVYHDTNGLNHGPGQDPVVPLERNLYGHLVAETGVWKAIWENPIETWLGENSELWMSLCTSWTGLFLSVYADEIQLAGKKQNIDPMWKLPNRCRFGRTHIFTGSCILGMHSTTIPNM